MPFIFYYYNITLIEMSSFKESLKPLATKYKFWFAVQGMEDKDILEFIQEDIFVCDNLDLPFEEAKAKCEKVLGKSLGSFMSEDDQKELFKLLQKWK